VAPQPSVFFRRCSLQAATDPLLLVFGVLRRPLRSTLFPYTTLFRSGHQPAAVQDCHGVAVLGGHPQVVQGQQHGQAVGGQLTQRSEEHTSELQSRFDLVCRLLLEKKNTDEPRRCTTTPCGWELETSL